jgi:putative flavoprotein involved in K+ transport
MVSKIVPGTKNSHTVIIGGGQAGLATGYFLKKADKDFIILDENKNIGDSWRNRWDSLLLFTPAQHDSLPGMPFPASRGNFPGKDQMADYLEIYATTFSLPVHSGVKVNHIYSRANHYEIEISGEKLLADKVVIATGTNPHPYIPSISEHIAPDIFQIHSSSYHNPESLPAGDVLVVGAATSGIEIALEISKTHKTFISGRPPFHIPDKVFKYAGEVYWWFVSNILTVNTPIGKKAKEKIIHGGSPLIRVSYDDLEAAGVDTLPRLTELNNGRPQFENGSVLNVSSIIWATGYRPDFSWVEMNITDESGWPMTKRGISSTNNGLYFIGMPFQFGLTSGLVGGVGRDADYISRHILSH